MTDPKHEPTAREITLEILREQAAYLKGINAHLAAFREELNAGVSTIVAAIANQAQAAQAAQAAAPATQASAPGGGYIDFMASTIVVTTNDEGERRYKIKGDQYSLYGVYVWPEVLPNIGINDADLDLGENEFTAMVRAILNGNNQPKKITGLTPEGTGTQAEQPTVNYKDTAEFTDDSIEAGLDEIPF